MDNDSTPAVLGLSEGLGPASEAREMAAFVAWAVKKYRQHAYRHTSATSGEWAAWQAAVAAERENYTTLLHAYHQACVDAANRANEIDRLHDRLRQIGDRAHDASTGPAVPDVLWEIRSMAYDGIRA
jgi:hypothetical protein